MINVFRICLVLVLLAGITSCKKLNTCKNVFEIKGRTLKTEGDLSKVATVPEFVSALANYPQLEPQRLILDDIESILHCQVFYKNLIVFTDGVSLIKNSRDNTFFTWGTIPDTIAISLTPGITAEQAIDIAKTKQDYDQSCVSYRLGIYDLNAGNSTATSKNYKLVWDIAGGTGEYPEVVVDANSGKVYYSDDGLRE